MASRLTYIDIARGICIILVVIGHFMPSGSPGWYVTMRDIIYCFHMPLFMYVSGFVYRRYQKPVPYKEFITKKFKRLMIPYFLISLLIIGIKLVVERNMLVENPVQFSSIYEILYRPSAGVFLWFVYVLFLIFLLIPFFNTNRKINGLLVASIILLLIPVELTSLFCLPQFKANLFYFVLGCFTSQYDRLREQTGRIPVVIKLVVFCALYLPLATSLLTPSLLYNTFRFCLAVTGIAIIVDLSHLIDNKFDRLKKLFLRLALYSYTIYLFHTTFLGFAKSILMKSPLSEYIGNDAGFILIVLIACTVGIVGPIILYEMDSRLQTIRQKK